MLVIFSYLPPMFKFIKYFVTFAFYFQLAIHYYFITGSSPPHQPADFSKSADNTAGWNCSLVPKKYKKILGAARRLRQHRRLEFQPETAGWWWGGEYPVHASWRRGWRNLGIWKWETFIHENLGWACATRGRVFCGTKEGFGGEGAREDILIFIKKNKKQ